MEEQNLNDLVNAQMAIFLLRPGARYEVYNGEITIWDDPRPCPDFELIKKTSKQLQEFEDSIPTIWLPEQIEKWNSLVQK